MDYLNRIDVLYLYRFDSVTKLKVIFSKMEKYEPLPEEEEQEYIQRVLRDLPHWPEEVIKSWLWWGKGLPTLFETLDLTRLSFEALDWPNEKIPGVEVFQSGWGNNFEDAKLDLDASVENPGSYWLADYMWEHGTWNTGIILFENRDPEQEIRTGYGQLFKQPYQLLEGHNRLTFLNRLIELGKAAPKHKLWIARLA